MNQSSSDTAVPTEIVSGVKSGSQTNLKHTSSSTQTSHLTSWLITQINLLLDVVIFWVYPTSAFSQVILVVPEVWYSINFEQQLWCRYWCGRLALLNPSGTDKNCVLDTERISCTEFWNQHFYNNLIPAFILKHILGSWFRKVPVGNGGEQVLLYIGKVHL